MLWYISGTVQDFYLQDFVVLHKNGRGVADLTSCCGMGAASTHSIVLCLFLEDKDKNYASMTRQKLI